MESNPKIPISSMISKIPVSNRVKSHNPNFSPVIPKFQIGFMGPIKEACYRRVPVVISLHVSIFPVLAVLEIHSMVLRSSQKSNLFICRPCKFPLYPMKPRKQSSWARGMKFLQYETGWARGCSEVQKSTVSCLL